MDHIARRQRKSRPLSLRRLLRRLAQSPLFKRGSRKKEHAMSGLSLTEHITQWLRRIWFLPDSARWMDPLPSFHRRGIIFAAVVILMAFLWPSASPYQKPGSLPNAQPTTTTPIMQAELSDRQGTSRQQLSSANADSQRQWHSYQIASGQTLAQLFRDHNLPVNDVFAMAQVEGNDKPLSNLQSGQTVKIRQNDQGMVTDLTVESTNGQVLFTRQPDGSFLRAQ
ncbi:Opacity-associated protein A [Erwinia tracheiphila]|uniref:Opacity-associated protein A n=2 Tax=Erwinia tracheiphila TaxID=65700 RepID=A0A345CXP8_9GAMM|nr:Opacity-associated protein A [Erwinia tracheiphila]